VKHKEMEVAICIFAKGEGEVRLDRRRDKLVAPVDGKK